MNGVNLYMIYLYICVQELPKGFKQYCVLLHCYLTECRLMWARVITNGWKYETSLAIKWCINNSNGCADHEAAYL